MQEIIGRVTAVAGLDETTARKAIAIVLELIKSEAPAEQTNALFGKLQGAEELAAEAGGSGGLFGAIGGSTVAAFSKLTQAGLTTGQMQDAGKELIQYAKEQAGEDLVNDVINSIPGLGKFV